MQQLKDIITKLKHRQHHEYTNVQTISPDEELIRERDALRIVC